MGLHTCKGILEDQVRVITQELLMTATLQQLVPLANILQTIPDNCEG